jgi:hypothetical protein
MKNFWWQNMQSLHSTRCFCLDGQNTNLWSWVNKFPTRWSVLSHFYRLALLQRSHLKYPLSFWMELAFISSRNHKNFHDWMNKVFCKTGNIFIWMLPTGIIIFVYEEIVIVAFSSYLFCRVAFLGALSCFVYILWMIHFNICLSFYLNYGKRGTISYLLFPYFLLIILWTTCPHNS